MRFSTLRTSWKRPAMPRTSMELRAARRELREATGLGRRAVVRAVVRAAAKAVDGGGGMGAIVRAVDARRCLRDVARAAVRDVRRLAERIA